MMGMDLVRAWSSTFFHRFGIHCATHQIRLILISGLVITSLFYPALWIYSDSVRKFPISSSSRAVAPLFGLSPEPLSIFQDDLENVWNGHEALRILDNTVARAKCGMEETLRVERILLTNNEFDADAGAINHQLLQSALHLETDLASHLSANSLNCLSTAARGCISLSPLEFWSHDEGALLSDRDLLRTVNKQRNISVSGLPLRSSMVFSGRESAGPRSTIIDFASYVALTYFFHEGDCHSSNGHRAWLNVLHDIAPSIGETPRVLQEPTLLALEFNPGRKTGQHVSLITITLYLSYIIFFVYFSGSMRRMDSVHSRIGLCFTGLVEILVSTITSLSVCAIFGLRITLVPWGIFPIVIVFVGAENMFRLIDDVSKTPISLPMKERIGVGLSRAGTSNTLKVVSYNTILGVIAFLAHGAIRQFCAFAIVVLVAHWFLIHTFFVAVLSIDIQRLELDDLLRHSTNLVPHSNGLAETKTTAKTSIMSRMAGGVQKATKGRLAKNFSLMLLLVITSTLYYSTLPGHTEHRGETARSPATRASVLQSKAEQRRLDVHSGARDIWRVFNPEENKLVHLRIEAPTIVVIDHKHNDNIGERRAHWSRGSGRSLRLLWWFFKVMVLPIGATLSALYGLLLYLLKDTDRLENHRSDDKEDSEEISAPIDDVPSFKTFPRTFPSDVGLLAANKDGSVLASVSTDDEVFVWTAAWQKYILIDTMELILKSASTSSVRCSLSAVAVDDDGAYCAVGTGSGLIGIWAIKGDTVQLVSQLVLDACASPVTQIEFSRDYNQSWESARSMEKAVLREHTSTLPCVLAIHANGRAVQWLNGTPAQYSPSRPEEVVKAHFVHFAKAKHPAVCFFFGNGGLEISEICRTPTSEGSIFIQAGSAEDHVMELDACMLSVDETPHVLVAAVTYSGVITLWDATTGDCILALDDTMGSVTNLRLLPIQSRACSQCGEAPLCSFSLAYSVGHITFIDRGILARRCSCPLNQPLVSKMIAHKDSPIGRRSRSGSFVSSSGADSVPRVGRHASFSNDNVLDVASFPVSAHGRHSRRGSEKDASRRGNDKFDTPAFSALEDLSGASGGADEHQRLTVPDTVRLKTSSPDLRITSLWRNFRLVRILETTCMRGGWDLLDGKIVGIRRRPRKRDNSSEKVGKQPEKVLRNSELSISVLDRWEVWIFNPSKPNAVLKASTLSSLRLEVVHSERDENGRARKLVPRLSFTRLSPLVIKSPICLAGFGNTIGMIAFGST